MKKNFDEELECLCHNFFGDLVDHFFEERNGIKYLSSKNTDLLSPDVVFIFIDYVVHLHG